MLYRQMYRMNFLSKSSMEEKMPHDDIALNAGKPVFDLVQTGRAGRRAVHRDPSMLCQERLNHRGRVAAQLVADDEDLAPWRLGATISSEKPTSCTQVCRAAVWPALHQYSCREPQTG